MSYICHTQKLNDFGTENLTKITANVKKRLKTALLSNDLLEDEKIDHSKKNSVLDSSWQGRFGERSRHDAINFLKFRNIISKEPHRMRKYCHCNEISQCDPKVMMTLLMRLPLRFPPPLAPSFPLVQQHELPYCHHIDHFDILYNNRLSGVFVICQ